MRTRHAVNSDDDDMHGMKYHHRRKDVLYEFDLFIHSPLKYPVRVLLLTIQAGHIFHIAVQ